MTVEQTALNMHVYARRAWCGKELGHVLLHDPHTDPAAGGAGGVGQEPSTAHCRGTGEVEAESLAYSRPATAWTPATTRSPTSPAGPARSTAPNPRPSYATPASASCAPPPASSPPPTPRVPLGVGDSPRNSAILPGIRAIHVTGGMQFRWSSTAGSLGDAPGSVDVRGSVVAFVVFSMAAWWR